MARQVYVPPLRATVTKFNVAIGHCHDCGRRGCREPIPSRPPTLWARRPRGSAGAAKAWAMWLHYSLGLSFGKTRQVLARLGGERHRQGRICGTSQTAASKELVPVHADLVRAANRSATLTMDETGWRVGGAWLWVATNPEPVGLLGSPEPRVRGCQICLHRESDTLPGSDSFSSTQ
jgi:hypothetical protein